MTWTFAYRARFVRVIDGDTLDVDIDRGFGDTLRQRVRLLGVNTPETHDTDPSKRAGALAATNYVRAWCTQAFNEAQLVADPWELRIATAKSDVFGRYLARVWKAADYGRPDLDLSGVLITAGLGVSFMVTS